VTGGGPPPPPPPPPPPRPRPRCGGGGPRGTPPPPLRTALLVTLFLAGLVLAYVAHQSPEPTYVAPRPGDLPQAAPTELVGEVPPGCVVRELDVTGMCCTGCTQKLHDVLTSLDGVVEAAVDFRTSSARAVVPRELPVETLVAALDFDQYAAQPRP